jgi:radical SAM-linked protein
MTKANKVRLRFSKHGDLRLVSHLDLLRCLERMLRRAQIPVATSHGFNPRPRMTFALALGVGIEGHREVVDLELSEPMDPSGLLQRLAAVAPPGLLWIDACPLPPAARSPQPRAVEYCIPVRTERRRHAASMLQSLLASASWPLTRRRPDRESTFDLRPQLIGAELTDEGLLRFRLKVAPEGCARPEELLEALALRDLLECGAILARTDVELDA